jgi:hypothetical protein
MKRRFVLLLVFLLAPCLAAPAQRPGEGGHEQGGQPAETMPGNTPRANQGKIPPPPQPREATAKAEPEKRENGKITTTQHVNNAMDTTPQMTRAITWTIRMSTDSSNTSARTTATTFVRIDRDHHRFWLPGGLYFEAAPDL